MSLLLSLDLWVSQLQSRTATLWLAGGRQENMGMCSGFGLAYPTGYTELLAFPQLVF